ncbi:hypothetical protein LSTR_LSTR016899, partial [Laodelphax striatellus]
MPSEEDHAVRECSVVLQRLNISNVNYLLNSDENNRMDESLSPSNLDEIANNSHRNNEEGECDEEKADNRKRRISQESIDNPCAKKVKNEERDMDYTMDDIIVCDDDDEEDDFPCSQIFDDPENKVFVDSDDNDSICEHEVIEVDEENDEYDDNEKHWLNRLSQTFDSPAAQDKQQSSPIIISDDDDDEDGSDLEKELASTTINKSSAAERDVNSEQRLVDEIDKVPDKTDEGIIQFSRDNIVPIVTIDDEIACDIEKESIDEGRASNSENVQVLRENIGEEIDSDCENICKESAEEERAENEEKLTNYAKPRTRAVTRRQIKLVEAIPLTTNRRTRSKESKNKTNLTKKNDSPLKPSLTNEQKTTRRKKLKTIASLDRSDEVTPAINESENDRLHSKSAPCVKVTSKSRTDTFVDSLIDNKPSTSRSFKIPKLKKSHRNNIDEIVTIEEPTVQKSTIQEPPIQEP